MNAKRVTSAVLLMFVAVSLTYLVVSEATSSSEQSKGLGLGADADIVAVSDAEAGSASDAIPSAAPDASRAPAQGAPRQLIAYYFHNTQRCKTCLKIERLSQEALREGFPAEFEGGQFEWRALNMEDPPNVHFVDDYQLVTSSLVLVDVRDGSPGEWSRLDEVWQLVHEEESAFKKYVVEQTRQLLESES